jgi:hypothetical protein
MRKPRACLVPDLCLGRLATPENPKNLHDFPSFYLTLISTRLGTFQANFSRINPRHQPETLLIQNLTWNDRNLPPSTLPTIHTPNPPAIGLQLSTLLKTLLNSVTLQNAQSSTHTFPPGIYRLHWLDSRCSAYRAPDPIGSHYSASLTFPCYSTSIPKLPRHAGR